MTDAYELIRLERERQLAKWGHQRHLWADWVAILGEEFGEVAKAVCDIKWDNGPVEFLRDELVQVAAVSVAAIEQINEYFQTLKDFK